MTIKAVIPLAIRDQFRPAWQRLLRDWSESSLSSKPEPWRASRERAHRLTDLDELLTMAASEFGITQVRSEIIGLLERLRAFKPRTIVEVGTHKGGNSFLFCHALESAEHIVGVDLCVQNSSKLIYFTKPGQIYRALHGDSQTQEMRSETKRQLKGRSVDFLFIDGDHTYEGAKADFELYSSLVRPGGMIAFHDIVPDHRTRFGRETGCYAGEVYKLWNELKGRYEFEELIENPEQDGFGIGIIRIPLV